MKRLPWLLLGLIVPALAFAAAPHVQASMVVTGAITVNPDGSVRSYTVRDLDKLPPAARNIIQATVPHWRFVPILSGGKAIAAQAGMSLRIVADMLDARHAAIRIAGAAFGCDALPRSNLPGECPAGTAIRYAHRMPPRYPVDALRARVGGEVFLVLQIGRDGHVTQAAARRVNLYTMTDDQAYYRKVLADASVRTAERWTFQPPTIGPNTAKDHWVVVVPVNYWIGPPDSAPARHYGRWNAYIPGPVQTIPWAGADGRASGSADAVVGGAPFTRDTRFVLKTPLSGGSTGQT